MELHKLLKPWASRSAIKLYQWGFSVFLFFQLQSAIAALPSEIDQQKLPSLAPMLERSMPAVVNIATRTEIRPQYNPLLNDPFFRRFFRIPNQPEAQTKPHSLGSGVIVDAKNGYVITNNHVIDNADEIMVTLRDGRQLNATLVGTDPDTDIAVIKIPAEKLVALPVANSDQLRVGDFAVAIGNPFGLGQTVTSGIISALGRSGLGIEGYEDFIQTDASINPGNSGGALVNLRGELIGINTAIIAPGGGNVGIGFAIPSNMALRLKTALIEHGKVQRGYLGIRAQDLTPDLAKAFDLNQRQGAVVTRIEENSPAAKKGVRPGDIILSVNGRSVRHGNDIRNLVGLLAVGEQVELEVMRAGERKIIELTISLPQIDEVNGAELHPSLSGVTLADNPRDQLSGVRVIALDDSARAKKAGLLPDDVIVVANRYRVRSVKELLQVVSQSHELLLNVQRGNEAFFIILR